MASGNAVDDPRRPAFFEMYAQERLVPMLRPAIKHVIAVRPHCLSFSTAPFFSDECAACGHLSQVLAERNPRLLWLHNAADNVLTGGFVMLEGYFLRKHGATFAENFYGLQRAPSFGGSGAGKLTLRQQLSSVLCMVLLPHWKEKLDDWYNEELEASDSTSWRYHARQAAARAAEAEGAGEEGEGHEVGLGGVQLAQLKEKLRGWLVRLYPVLHAVFEAVVLLYRLRYMFDYGNHFHPFLHAQGLVVQRMSMHDQLAQPSFRDQLQRRVRENEMGLGMRLLQTSQKAAQMGLDSIKYMLLMSVFGFRFMDWWYSSDTNAAVRPKMQLVPAPKAAPPPHPDGIQLPEDRTLCGLCNQQRTNPAATPTGFVFCYPCIFAYTGEHGLCPVTHCRMQQGSIRRVYEAQ